MALLEWQSAAPPITVAAAVSEATLAEAEQLGVTGLGALSAPGRALLAASEGEESAVEARAAARAPGRAPVARASSTRSSRCCPPVDHVLLQADLTAVAPGRSSTSSRASSALLAEVESTGGATVYRFSESTVRRALDAGRSAPRTSWPARGAVAHPVPQPLEYLVTDVARRHGAVRVGLASAYVRCDDPTTIASCWPTAAPPRRAGPARRHRARRAVHAGRGARPAA